ncbi:hypothetical protein PHLGIDRAFT_473188 [Phlebiopsis gigantea 11061_1 CR5-6]|uniref:Uncharacterized protein n=1 Tax=Phlebiopsis gigantea (strain 11061_1 CR5-6) TaxID=745531 RepID=A0A0C3P0V3_PHLG1|nr:hypothetical protein PHLGIDRAFT_473188 [Phlebiopsis gigantea 11061_1 CR5-6]
MDPSAKRYTLDGCRLRDRSKKEVLVNLAKLEREVETERNKVAKSKLRKHLQLGFKQAARHSTGEQARQRNHEEGNDDVEEREVSDAVNQTSENHTDDEPNILQRSVPPTEAVPRPSRGNKFTEAEMESCQELCKDLMNNDPTISTMEIASRLAEKVKFMR